MNIKNIAIASFCGAMISTSAFAGFFLDAGIGAGKTKVTWVNSSDDTQSWSKTSPLVSISGGYEFDSESQMKYSVGLSTSHQALNLNEDGDDVATIKYKTKNVMFTDLFARAKYAIDNKHSVYGTLGFTASSNKVQVKADNFVALDDTASSGGFLVGIGYELSFNQKLKFFTEANFRKTTSGSVEANEIGVDNTSTFVTIGARYYF